MKILLVEDDVRNAEMVNSTIKRWDHQIAWASTGKEAMEKARKNTFDLVLLDIMLPDVMGYELIPEFRRYHSGIKIITMAGQNNLEMERKTKEYGITYYMAKPFSFDELKSILDHLSRKKVLQEEKQ